VSGGLSTAWIRKNLFDLLVIKGAPFNKLALYAIRPIALFWPDRHDARRREISPQF
jgi:hypothetical protein